MRIKRVKYINYRCFKNVEINFKTQPGKNVFMVLAPNGGGKTEMLFSFQWVLYGFDFTKIKAKESTPYSLNSTIYQNLKEKGYVGTEKWCSVELDFEYEGTEYRVIRREIFKRQPRGIGEPEHTVSLSWKKPDGTRTLPITDENAYIDKLSRIIPQNILQGIIFDGERMRSLSSDDTESKHAVEGVIKQITNQALFTRCRSELTSIAKEVSADTKKESKKIGADELTEIVEAIKENNSAVEKNTISLEQKRKDLSSIKTRLDAIHIDLEAHEESKQFEQQRENLRKELDQKEQFVNEKFDELNDHLSDGYLLLCDQLFDDVEDLIQRYDIPAGLTVEAVKHILERDTCICGHPFSLESRAILNELISKLPPDNVNSTIGEMVNQQRRTKNRLFEQLKRVYDEISKGESKIQELKDQIDNISSQIASGAPELIKALEEENKKLLKKEGALEMEIPKLEEELIIRKKELIRLNKQKEEGSRATATLSHLQAKDAFITKCIKALDAIEEYNKRVSLADITRRINSAYSEISEDYDNGRRLYIVQFKDKDRYKLQSFLYPKLMDLYQRLTKDNTIKVMEREGKNREEIQEDLILRVLESNSTGQSKINSLAFAKAILDYSRAQRADESTDISRSYPFIIDSPFTELSDGNLHKSAEAIHFFADQVILMISQESLDGVMDEISPYIGGMVQLSKSKTDAESKVITAK